MFNLMQKNDSIMNIVMLTMRELKNLLISSGTITMFMVSDEYVKGIQGIEMLSNETLFQSKVMLDSGKLVETVSNV